ncbi:MAG TPA: translation initiation factor IF-2 [Syntrophomonadaceae bacterium]|nr:translation initiation factor IF-2 [Syntrophomonadaceae bacterium]
MAKIRVHELAKELDIPSKDMVKTLQDLGLNIKNHMSTLEDSQANWVRKRLKNEPEAREAVTPQSKPGKVNGNFPEHRPEPKKQQSGPEAPREFKPNAANNYKAGQNEKPRVKEGGQQNLKTSQNHMKSHTRPADSRDGIPNHVRNSQNTGNQQTSRPVRRDNNNDSSGKKPFTPGGNRDSRPIAGGKKEGNKNIPPNRDGKVNSPEAKKDPRPFKGRDKYHSDSNDSQSSDGGKKNAPRKDYSRQIKKGKHKKRKEEVNTKPPEFISIEDSITVRDLAEKMNRPAAEIVKKLMDMGTMASINQIIDYDTAEILASLYEVRVEHIIPEEKKLLEEIIDDEDSLEWRPPIVTIMGHVDHGKTSLLDRIRKSNVVSGEAGGITQHIGAYQAKVNNNKITFIDTPGHEAFTAMRARGANITDIVVLVVAADDGVMPQTVEAINHIKAAEVPFLVALNKIDKPGANPDKVKQQLTEYNIVSEDWGGDTIFVPVSAKTGEGIDSLLEMILLVAEMNEIKANPNRPAEGVVIEGQLDKGRGAVATVLVQKGTLNVGDCLVCGVSWCKVRAMTDYRGNRVDKALASMPVEIMGWSEVPEAGHKVVACDEKVAKEIISLRLDEKKIEEQKKSSRVSLDDFFKQMQDSEIKELRLIIKGDVQGSVEAMVQSLVKLSTDEVKVNVIHSGVGAITETDVMLASASNAIIIGFNVRPDNKARKYAEEESIDVRLYRVIYETIEDVKKAMAGLLEPEHRERFLGRAEVRAIFKVPGIGTVGGCYVTEGKISRNANARVLRDGVIVYEGKFGSLKRFKDDAKEVTENYECGLSIEDFNDIKTNDIIEAYVVDEIPREL